MEQHPQHPNGDKPHRPEQNGLPDIPVGRGALERIAFYLHATFVEADARGEAIGPDDARVIATLLTPLVGPFSALAHFVNTGEIDRAALEEECQRIKAARLDIPDVDLWIQRFEEHLASRADPGQAIDRPHTSRETDDPLIEQGLREHGDAFRAYLQLPDISRYSGDDLLTKFSEFYVGSFNSIDALLNELTDVRTVEDAIKLLDDHWGVGGLISLDRSKVAEIAMQVWDVVDLDGQFHVFNK